MGGEGAVVVGDVETSRTRDPELIAIGVEVEALRRDVDRWRGGPLEARARLLVLAEWLHIARERIGGGLQDVVARGAP